MARKERFIDSLEWTTICKANSELRPMFAYMGHRGQEYFVGHIISRCLQEAGWQELPNVVAYWQNQDELSKLWEAQHNAA